MTQNNKNTILVGMVLITFATFCLIVRDSIQQVGIRITFEEQMQEFEKVRQLGYPNEEEFLKEFDRIMNDIKDL